MATTSYTIIDIDEALRLADLAVELRGADFRYYQQFTNCSYAEYSEEEGDLAPACQIGLTLSLCGVSVRMLGELAGSIAEVAGFRFTDPAEPERDHGLTADDPAEAYASSVLTDTGVNELGLASVELSEGAVRIWAAIQDAQDSDWEWGDARNKGRRVAELLKAGT